MYEQQVAYLKKDKKWKNRQYHSIIKDGDKLYMIGKKTMIILNTTLQHPMHTVSSPLLPIEGHTSHMINDVLISLFGKTSLFDMIVFHNIPSTFTTFSFQQSFSPLKRYAHTSILLNDNNTLYVIGGHSLNFQSTLSDVWKLNWSTKQWIKVLDNINPIMGHSTILFPNTNNNNTLLTCFGVNQYSLHKQQFYDYCTLFNTHSLQYKYINHIPLLPRIYSSMVLVNNTHAFIYGGLSENNELLKDMWWIHFNDVDDDQPLSFIFIDDTIPRAKHTTLLLSDDHILIDGGEYIGSTMDETIIYNINHFNHHHKNKNILQPRSEPASSLSSPSSTNNNNNNNNNTGLTGGAIGGMITGIIIGIILAVTLFVFIQRKHRQHRTYDLHSRAARFSLSTPPRQSASIMERRSDLIQSPELAKTRLSQMSFGSEFRLSLNDHPHKKRQSNIIIPSSSSTSSLSIPNHNITFESPSRQLYTNWICETPLPPTTITRNSTFINNNNNNNNNHSNHHHHHNNHNDYHHHQLHSGILSTSTPSILLEDKKQQSSSSQNENNGIKKFRLSLFKTLEEPSSHDPEHHHQQQQSSSAMTTTATTTELSSSQLDDPRSTATTSKRRSSLFGLSKLLNLTDPSHHHESKLDKGQDKKNKREQEGNDDDFNNKKMNRLSIQNEMRASLGSRSVASVQWVGFNNDMDFSTNRSSPRLTVMNHRQSCTTISSSSGVLSGIASTTTSSSDDINNNHHHQHHNQSPRNTSAYRLSQRELKSWEENRLSWLVTPPPAPHRY